MDSDDRVFQMIPLERTLFVEGRSRDRKVGEFRGVVLALGWWSGAEPNQRRAWSESQPPTLFFLVSDRQKPAPVWVSGAEISNQDWISAMVPASLAQPPDPSIEEEPVPEGDPAHHE